MPSGADRHIEAVLGCAEPRRPPPSTVRVVQALLLPSAALVCRLLERRHQLANGVRSRDRVVAISRPRPVPGCSSERHPLYVALDRSRGRGTDTCIARGHQPRCRDRRPRRLLTSPESVDRVFSCTGGWLIRAERQDRRPRRVVADRPGCRSSLTAGTTRRVPAWGVTPGRVSRAA